MNPSYSMKPFITLLRRSRPGGLALRLGLYAGALLVVAGAGALRAQATAALGAVTGTVAVVRADGSAIQPAGPGTPIGPGDRVATVGPSNALIQLPGLGEAELGGDATVILTELAPPGGGSAGRVALELVRGFTLHRVSAPAGTSFEYRVTDPSGQAVALVRNPPEETLFGVGRDENGNLTVACGACPSDALSFPTDGSTPGSGRARTLTARGDLVDERVRGTLYDALARGAAADEDDGDTPSTARLPAGQRTGSRDDRRPRDDDDDDAANQPSLAGQPPLANQPPPTDQSGQGGQTTSPSVVFRIVAPPSGQEVSGAPLTITWEARGIEIVPAAAARRREDLHAHVFLDRDPSPYLGTGRPIPFNDPNIVHTASRTVTFQNVAPGPHRVELVLAYSDHVAVDPPVRDAATFAVVAGAATATATASPTMGATPTATVTPTATPTRGPMIQATIANFVYLPDPIRIPPGGTVTWVNLDPTEHTATSEDLTWSSPLLDPGESYSRTFVQRGTYRYFCEPHPQMRGEVIVE